MPYPHRTRPMTALLVFTGLNFVLVSTISPVYDFVCFLPYWERRSLASLEFGPKIAFNLFFCCILREQRRLEREALSNKSQSS